ncbi:hypothetical protein AAC387_Pa02g1667 [Persea americana]
MKEEEEKVRRQERKKRKSVREEREGWCAVGAGGGEEEKKAYLVQGETSGGRRCCCMWPANAACGCARCFCGVRLGAVCEGDEWREEDGGRWWCGRWRMMGRRVEMGCSVQEEEDGESGSAGKKMEPGGDGL